MIMKPVIFREYDIRGVVDSDFDEGFAETLGRAYVVYLSTKHQIRNPRVSLGHDARLSCAKLVKGLAKGLTESGATVIHLGLVTTPVSYFSTFAMDIHGAFMITGSHNPPEYNGFKISVGKGTIFGDEIQELYRIIQRGEFIRGQGKEEKFDILTPYVERYRKEFSALSDVKVVLDCGNGAAGSVVRRMYEACGLKPTVLFEEPDGRFPNHHPDPTVEENLTALKNKVLETKADIGIGFDGDADRIGVVDENGRMLYGDELMVLVSRSILKDTPHATIIGDVKCSDRLYQDISEHGGNPIMWKTGHSLIKQKIKEEKAPFGGELSGHVFFADRNYGYDDAPYAGLRVAEMIAKAKKPLSSLLSGLPPSFSTPEIRIDTTEEKKVSIVKALQEKFSKKSSDYKVNLIDGIRVSYADGWALARASNTQPVLVLRFESHTQTGLNRIRSEIETFVQARL